MIELARKALQSAGLHQRVTPLQGYVPGTATVDVRPSLTMVRVDQLVKIFRNFGAI